MSKNYTVALVGEYFSENLGEPLLFDCAEYLVKRAYGRDICIKRVDFVNAISKKKVATMQVAAVKQSTLKKTIKTIIEHILGEKNTLLFCRTEHSTK